MTFPAIDEVVMREIELQVSLVAAWSPICCSPAAVRRLNNMSCSWRLPRAFNDSFAPVHVDRQQHTTALYPPMLVLLSPDVAQST
jgi:hypothetical protein